MSAIYKGINVAADKKRARAEGWEAVRTLTRAALKRGGDGSETEPKGGSIEMKSTAIVVLVTLGATAAAHADSPSAGAAILECGTSVQDIGPQDKDVSVEKSVSLVNGQWSVVHRVLSGHVYNRASQYEIRDTTSPGGLPQWRGTRLSNPALTMVGEVTAGAGTGMAYQEWLYKNGRLIMHTTSACHWSRGSQPLRIASVPSQIVPAPAYAPPPSVPALTRDNNSPMHPMTFRVAGNGGNCNSCEWFVGDGEITADTPRDFERFMADKGYSSLLYLNSPGGNLGAGIELGEEIRAHGLSTAVAVSVSDRSGWEEQTVRGLCASACAYAFLGGVSRTAKAGELGVHQFFGKFDLSSSQEVSGTLVSYVAKMGVDPLLVSIASSASPEDVHFLTAQELAAFKITVDDDAFGPWEIKPVGSGVVAISETPDHGKIAMLMCAQNGDRAW